MTNDALDTKGLDAAELAGLGNNLVKELQKDLGQASFRDKVLALKTVTLSLASLGATPRGSGSVEDWVRLLEEQEDEV